MPARNESVIATMNSPVLNSPKFSRLSGVITGLLLIVLLAGWLLPASLQANLHQFDFWLVWLLCMLFLALPFTLLEVALAKRSQASPLAAIAVLTREADIKPIWRTIAWLAAGLTALVSGGFLFDASQTLVASLQPTIGSVSVYLPIALIVIALALSFIPRFVLLAVALVGVLAGAVLALANADFAGWQWTAFSLKEWAWTVVLALVSAGLGYGIYWQMAAQSTTERAIQWALPVWLAQLVGGLLFALSVGHAENQLSSVLYSIALLTTAAALVGLLRSQLQARALAVVLQWVFILLGLAVWLLPIQPVLTILTVLLGLVVCLFYAIFSGWLMKISHLRKALNFRQEVIYNLWRVLVRIAIPLALVIAIISWLLPA